MRFREILEARKEIDPLDVAEPLSKSQSYDLDFSQSDYEKELDSISQIIKNLPPIQQFIINATIEGSAVTDIAKKLNITTKQVSDFLEQARSYISRYSLYDPKTGQIDIEKNITPSDFYGKSGTKLFYPAYQRAQKLKGKVIQDPSSKAYMVVNKNHPGQEMIPNPAYEGLKRELMIVKNDLDYFRRTIGPSHYIPTGDHGGYGVTRHPEYYQTWKLYRSIKNKMRVTPHATPKKDTKEGYSAGAVGGAGLG